MGDHNLGQNDIINQSQTSDQEFRLKVKMEQKK